MKNHFYYPRRCRSRGLTLVELLVAMVAGLFLMAGVIQIFLSNKSAYRTLEGLSRAQENGRIAIELLARDARMAGFWGCTKNPVKIHLDNDDAGYIDFANGISGTDGGTGDPPASDRVVFRGASGQGYPARSGDHRDDTIAICGNSGSAINDNDNVLVSNCADGDIFRVTNSPSGSVCDSTNTIEHGGKELSVIYDNSLYGNAFDGSDAYLYLPRQVEYRIEQGVGGEPALFRAIDGGTGQEMVDGVENLQILYGQDTDDPTDGSVNSYVPAGAVSDWGAVVSIRVAVVTRSYLDNATSQPQEYSIFGTDYMPNDRRFRQVYTATFAVRN